MQNFFEIGPAVQEKIFKGFYHVDDVWAWRSSWSCDWVIYVNIGSPFLQMFHIKFGFDWPIGFSKDDL